MSLRAHALKTLSRPCNLPRPSARQSPLLLTNTPTPLIRPARRAHSSLHSPSPSPSPSSSCKQSGTGLWTAALLVSIALGGALILPLVKTPAAKPPTSTSPETIFNLSDISHSYLVMAPNTPAGRPGTLTPQEEEKLRELWALTMKVFGVEQSAAADASAPAPASNGAETAAPVAAPAGDDADKDGKKDKKKSRLNVFRRHKGDKAEADKAEPAPTAGATPDISRLSLSAEDDKFGQNQDFKAAIANTPPEELRTAFWSMVKHDHPDALLLRFLRARKWDVEKALVMMISTMHWRLEEMHVDDDIVKHGELGAMNDAASAADAKAKKNAEDFLVQLRMGKSYLHGLDKEGRPMCIVRARLHKAGEQTEESLERFTVYTIETARLLLRPPIDTATIVFDMTDFSMANMDYTPVKFMIKCFEANYPESLGTVLVYKAPWVFNAVWSIVRGWLDPVVAGKVSFVKTVDELANFVPRTQIPKELGGDEDWTYTFPEPIAGENDKMNDTATRDNLLAERAQIVHRYETAVHEWVADGPSKPESLETRRHARDAVAEDLRKNYWVLDPYVRARTLYDRMGVIRPMGELGFYAKEGGAAVPASGAAGTVETSAEDLD